MPPYQMDGLGARSGYQMSPQIAQLLQYVMAMKQQQAQGQQGQQQPQQGQGGSAGSAVQGIAAKKVQEKLYPHLREAIFGPSTPKVDPSLPQLTEILGGGRVPGVQGIGPVADGAAYADALGASPGTFDLNGGVGDFFGNNPYLQGGAGAVGLGLGAKGMYDSYKSGNPLGGAVSGAGAGMGGLALAGALGASTGGLALPVIAGAALLGGGAGAFGGHKSTKQIQGERTNDLIGRTQDRSVQQDLIDIRGGTLGERQGVRTDEAGLRHQANLDAHAQQFGTPNSLDLKTAIPEQIWGSEGVLATFGPDQWLRGYNEDQRYAITDALIKNNLFRHDKGDIIINSREQDRARQIADQVSSGQYQSPQQPTQPQFQDMRADNSGMFDTQNRGGGNGAFVPGNQSQGWQPLQNMTPEQRAQSAAAMRDNSPASLDPGFNVDPGFNMSPEGFEGRFPGMYDDLMKGGAQPPQPQQQRTTTRSPGIGLDGRRISY